MILFGLIVFASMINRLSTHATAQDITQKQINTAQDFVDLFDNETKTFVATNVTVHSNITFNESTSSLLPIGFTDEGTCVPFYGVFDGRNHTIQGINMTNEHKSIGLFCAVANASISNIVFDETNVLSGSEGGALGVKIEGNQTTIVNVHTAASISCHESGCDCGGLFGNISCNHCVVELEYCVNSGVINSTGSQHTGGLVGAVLAATNVSMNLKHCSNTGTVVASDQDGSPKLVG